MQETALLAAGAALKAADDGVTPISRQYDRIAKSTVAEFQRLYGGIWQCVVGSRFGSNVEHRQTNMIYFKIGDFIDVLLYQD